MPNTKLTEGKNGAVILMFKGYSVIVNKYATHSPKAKSPEVCTIAISRYKTEPVQKDESKYEQIASEMLNTDELDVWITKLIKVSQKKVVS